ncbi:hypothetical protein A3F00_00945 [Candidatus Daviesbacteria bacterium RIFCSPHIGHO2_12_FULL_37_11]|uniref:Ribosomal subunit interface protein n=1 Tax=Candidatus Daviesbacteria bacterium RIFCSPHIGHO2_12_FULL_37_11 TaxID=1797777 RepID=A0A1F5K8L0_9BACT|nr:MAG: hypothetical protein A2111_00125 [Candidatus Daviesbacteria bacterium GWA1_38_6]OGE17406.1 MAG: hypothetical protein A2769_04520 [Candidatus Daviesbacteria bacterium RIFCSPHIGHO2_01_FULL_37_27]OGE37282.1 MAG: hypothetical protein A3F00_00945 [Candidatus Daviesbacteria bacterium RIFCSPHIGHO2_12_FULL_37_11]OGE46047.1 MAG: hypothetical protein A3B39_03500 [Candidatus Daviesbacteria bacterium RIFCSPLOWO2_01_FULL_37_10]
MILNITSKHVFISSTAREEIEKKVNKLSSLLPNMAEDLAQIDVNLKARKRNSYRIKLALKLPGDFLTVRLHKETVGEVLKSSFNELLAQVKHYRERHFKSLSRYPGRDSIRRGDLWMQGLNWQ